MGKISFEKVAEQIAYGENAVQVKDLIRLAKMVLLDNRASEEVAELTSIALVGMAIVRLHPAIALTVTMAPYMQIDEEKVETFIASLRLRKGEKS